ncbi:hypothetical protein LX66_3644 [Chitinophaga japonensis]|uniref:Uncharacterized protein n=1 Tax=Chitinophaga japonensis TaxID=104662 RepID=A0A562SYH4_CHIJA|nr:hypothetical protein LX66_3644 [Chitinophaga japonensis]
MRGNTDHKVKSVVVEHTILDMSDCYTWSFPEFVPFCAQLYYFSNFKDFNTFAQA